MGTFLGHLVPGLAIALLGLWHTINTIRSFYLRGATKFKSRFWYPFYLPFANNLQHLELILVFSFSIFAILFQILDYPFLQFSFKLDNFEHATMFLHLAIFSGFTLLAERANLPELHHSGGISGILASLVFAQELFLLHYHSVDHAGLEGHYHFLLQLIVFVSLMAALCSGGFSGSFPAALLLSITLLFQGCWFVNMGFALWVPEFIPEGCVSRAGGTGGAVVCRTHESGLRARALANLQFSWVLSGIMIFVGSVCVSFARKVSDKTDYEKLNNGVAAIGEFKQVHP